MNEATPYHINDEMIIYCFVCWCTSRVGTPSTQLCLGFKVAGAGEAAASATAGEARNEGSGWCGFVAQHAFLSQHV